jgi:uncharacterized protein (DUF58 family)
MSLIALPEALLKKIQRVEIRARGLVNDVYAGHYESAFKGRGMDFEEVREYTPGDDIRHIDWNVTARMNRPFVKRHRDERELTVFLLVDLSGSAQFGSHTALKAEVAAEIAAVLAHCALQSRDRVGLILFSDQIELCLPPKKSRGHHWQVIREILTYQPRSKGTDLKAPLERLQKVQKRRAVVFLLSDFLGVELPSELATVARLHDVVAIEIRDPRESRLPDVGFVELEDAETGRRVTVDTRKPETRRLWQERQERLRSARTRALRSRGVDHVEIDTDADPGDRLLRYFRLRELKG